MSYELLFSGQAAKDIKRLDQKLRNRILSRTEQLAENPFNPSTQIQFGLPQDGNIRLVVFNLLGHHVQVLAEGRYKAGLHSIIFEGANLTSGVYLYRLETATERLTGKMQLLR